MEKFTAQMRVGTGEKSRERQTIPGVVMAAVNKSGSFKYLEPFGFTSVDPDCNTRIRRDNTFWIASCTKLLTTICALQCVERGLVTLDEPISRILPEWSDPDVLQGFDEATGKPILRKAKNKITLRLLLTHSAGMSYEWLNGKLARFRELKGSADMSIIAGTYDLPLIYEPGEGWTYAGGIDWAGKMVERLHNNQSLESYMIEHIFKPLGMQSTTFRLAEHPDIKDRLVTMSTRDADGKAIPAPEMGWVTRMNKDDFGGGGLYSHPGDYIKLLHSLLKNDGTILRPETVKMMFEPQLKDPSHLAKFVDKQPGDAMKLAFTSAIPLGVEVNWGLGGMLCMQDTEGGRRKGTMCWCGLPNVYWWLDPEAGVAGIYATNVLPIGDMPTIEMVQRFEKAVYEEVGRKSKL